jgi:hypothetical protein
VAVLNTYEIEDPDEQEAEQPRRTRLLLPRAEVFAVGVYNDGGVTSAADEEGEGGSDGSGLILTVSEDQQDAELLIHATRTGLLNLANRQLGGGALAGCGRREPVPVRAVRRGCWGAT